jgi:hypothetical protein
VRAHIDPRPKPPAVDAALERRNLDIAGIARHIDDRRLVLEPAPVLIDRYYIKGNKSWRAGPTEEPLMETLSPFVLLLMVGAPIIGICIVAGVVDLARLILGVDGPVKLRDEAASGSNLLGRHGAPTADRGDGARATV